MRHAAFPQPEALGPVSARGNLDGHIAIGCLHADVPSHGGVEDGDVGIDIEVMTGSSIERMRIDFDVHDEVAGHAASTSRVPRRGKPQ